MQFSDTTNKNGLIQECEFWCNLGDGTISGDTTLLAQFTSRINRGFDRVMPLLLSHSDKIRWDDVNHTDHPIGTVNIVSGQHDYQMLVDDNGLSILNITDVMILDSATATEYRRLRRVTLDDPRALTIMSPNPSQSGIPSMFVEKDNVIFLGNKPNYSATAGMKLFFERAQSYFAANDTTKTPGIPQQFHMLLALYGAYDWLCVNKPENGILLGEIKAEIARQRTDLERSINSRNPTRRRLIAAQTDSV